MQLISKAFVVNVQSPDCSYERMNIRSPLGFTMPQRRSNPAVGTRRNRTIITSHSSAGLEESYYSHLQMQIKSEHALYSSLQDKQQFCLHHALLKKELRRLKEAQEYRKQKI